MLAELEERGRAAAAARRGFRRYEVSAWAGRDSECRHNLNYWRFGDYLAIGAGAHGKVTDPRERAALPQDAPARGLPRRRRAHDAPRSAPELDGPIAGEFMLNALRLGEGFTAGAV
jgi:hypothetical protein